MTATLSSLPTGAPTAAPADAPPERRPTAADWHASLGGVDLRRVLYDPIPGTATDAELLIFAERDKRCCEMVGGTLVEKVMGYNESVIAGVIIYYLNAFVIPHGLGLVTGEAGMMRMTGGNVRIPDVAFVARDRIPSRLSPIPSLGPDLAVEVLSPSNTPAEIGLKLGDYFSSGARLVWVVDPHARVVTVYAGGLSPSAVLREGDALDGGDVLPGFELPVAELFKNLPPVE